MKQHETVKKPKCLSDSTFFKTVVSQDSLYQIHTEETYRGNGTEGLQSASLIPSLPRRNSLFPLFTQTKA